MINIDLPPLYIKYKNIRTLETDPIYFFVVEGWLVTIHSKDIDILMKVRLIFSEQNKRILESPIDALYYSIVSTMVEDYEHILTAIELKVFEIEKKAQYKPSKKVPMYFDLLSKQAILLRRHFWQARDIINYHTHMEEDKEDIKFLRIVNDDINQLIEMVQSYQDTITSAREVFSNSVSLQLNDTMRTLTIISTIVLPITVILSIFGLQGFDLNNLTAIPRHFGLVLFIMVAIIGLTLFIFWRKQWIFSKELQIEDTNEVANETSDSKAKGERKIT